MQPCTPAFRVRRHSPSMYSLPQRRTASRSPAATYLKVWSFSHLQAPTSSISPRATEALRHLSPAVTRAPATPSQPIGLLGSWRVRPEGPSLGRLSATADTTMIRRGGPNIASARGVHDRELTTCRREASRARYDRHVGFERVAERDEDLWGSVRSTWMPPDPLYLQAALRRPQTASPQH